ncbi:MAG: adenosylcobinamide-GDP ribazoletransferase [Anaerolineae bacterium]|nr:adenosylcobinamide-GDP ribazoletransferase [Gloeobacterales cyanobacterium ES-bin-313]
MFRDLRVAIQFLTTLPLGDGGPEITLDSLGRAVRYYPLVGLLLGGILVGMHWLLHPYFPVLLVNLGCVAGLLGLTGMLHFDGFLDSCDGLFAARSPDERLEIMRDSRVGSFAVAGGWCLLSLKLAALHSLPENLMMPALLVAPMLGRWALVIAVVLFPYGREQGLGQSYKQFTTFRELIFLSFGVLGICYFALNLRGIILSVILFIISFIFGKWIELRLPKGLTGDSYGFITESIEACTWLVLCCSLGS